MRRKFADELIKQMRLNDKIFVLTGDLGYKMWDEIQKEFPGRFINCGAAEQTMLDIAVGMAYDGKIPFCYTITPFFLRAFETIRTYVDYENLPVKLVGAGRNDDYKHDGPSHNATDIGLYLNQLKNIQQFWPKSKKEAEIMVGEMVNNNKPSFISLAR